MVSLQKFRGIPCWYLLRSCGIILLLNLIADSARPQIIPREISKRKARCEGPQTKDSNRKIFLGNFQGSLFPFAYPRPPSLPSPKQNNRINYIFVVFSSFCGWGEGEGLESTRGKHTRVDFVDVFSNIWPQEATGNLITNIMLRISTTSNSYPILLLPPENQISFFEIPKRCAPANHRDSCFQNFVLRLFYCIQIFGSLLKSYKQEEALKPFWFLCLFLKIYLMHLIVYAFVYATFL